MAKASKEGDVARAIVYRQVQNSVETKDFAH